MYRVVYTSTARSLMNERELQQILRSARRNNALDLITGMLIYHEGCFLQVLEGPKAQVEKCYAKIQKDSRHQGCITLANDYTVSRLFSEWWMSYRTVGDLASFQKKQFLSLQHLAEKARDGEFISDLKTNALLLAFLSAFRDLEMTA